MCSALAQRDRFAGKRTPLTAARPVVSAYNSGLPRFSATIPVIACSVANACIAASISVPVWFELWNLTPQNDYGYEDAVEGSSG